MPTSNVKQIAEDFNIPFRTGFEIFPSIDNDSSVQDYAVPLKDSLRYEFAEFDKRPRTFGQDEDAEYVDLVKERPLFRCKLGRASCAIDSNTSTDVSISRKRSDQNSIFKVREVFALTNQLGTFFGNNKENFKKIFSTTFQGQRKPLSHHGDVIGAETEKAR